MASIRERLRRAVAIALLSVMALACGPDAPGAQEGLVPLDGSQAEALGLSRSLTGDLDAMVERGYIRALVPYGRTTYFLDGMKQRGVTYEALVQFEEWLNAHLDTGATGVRIVPIPTTRDQLLARLADGYGDLALGALTITPERAQFVDFSRPVATGVDEIVVTGATAPPVNSLDDLSGREVYVRESSSYYGSLVALNEDLVARGLAPATLAPAEEYLEDEDLLEMLNAGLIETIVVDAYKAELWKQVFDQIVPHPDVALRTGGEIAWAFRKNSPQLEELVNGFVSENRQGTEIGNTILNRYLQDASYIRNATAAEQLERMGDVIGYFRQYAQQYGFDYIMLMAQGYQESKLDQSLVSPAGAVGIMQLLPSTAADASVGISDISDPENNIHAGARYLAYIRDSYLDDPTLDEGQKTLMALAAYNAGPNRMTALREETAARGLDPNVWFRNVEIVAAEKIGRETVDYVASIYKYYAAYKLMIAHDEARAAANPGQ